MASPAPLGRKRRARHWPGVVVVAGGKGGVGTSTAAALLAVASARRGVETLLVEAVHALSMLPLLLGRRDEVPGLLGRGAPSDPAALVVALGSGLALLPGGGHAGELERIRAGERAARVRRASSLYDRYGMTVVDAGSHLDAVLGALAPGAERLVVVSDASRIGATAAYAVLKSVLLRHGALPLEFLVNRADEASARDTFGTVAEAAGTFLGQELRPAGVLPVDSTLERWLAEGRSLADLPGNVRALRAAHTVVERWHAQQAEARERGAPAISLVGGA